MTLTETDLREYKRQVTEETERSVVMFLNGVGGEMYIGVDDDGKVYGVDNYDEVARGFTDRIRNNVRILSKPDSCTTNTRWRY